MISRSFIKFFQTNNFFQFKQIKYGIIKYSFSKKISSESTTTQKSKKSDKNEKNYKFDIKTIKSLVNEEVNASKKINIDKKTKFINKDQENDEKKLQKTSPISKTKNISKGLSLEIANQLKDKSSVNEPKKLNNKKSKQKTQEKKNKIESNSIEIKEKKEKKDKKKPILEKKTEIKSELQTEKINQLQENESSEKVIETNKEIKSELTKQNEEKTTIEHPFLNKSQEFKIEYLQFPWDFNGIILPPKKEGNMLCPIDIVKVLKENQVISLIKSFIDSIEDHDLESLSKLLEYTFYKKLEKNLLKLKENNYTIESKNIKSKKNKLELFNITNIFGVGLNSNRLKNDTKTNYKILDGTIHKLPTTHIIHKKQQGTEKIKIFIQLDFILETEINFLIKDINQNNVLFNNSGKENNFHFIKLESEILETDKSYMESNLNKNIDDELMKLKKSNAIKFGTNLFYIIDFDNYMSGNEMVSDTLRIFNF